MSDKWWKHWGTTIGVKTGHGYDAEGFSDSIRDDVYTKEKGRARQAAGYKIALPINMINRIKSGDDYDLLFTCHSQGCNIAMSVLNKGCPKK